MILYTTDKSSGFIGINIFYVARCITVMRQDEDYLTPTGYAFIYNSYTRDKIKKVDFQNRRKESCENGMVCF